MDNARKQIKGDGGAVLPVPDLGTETEELDYADIWE